MPLKLAALLVSLAIPVLHAHQLPFQNEGSPFDNDYKVLAHDAHPKYKLSIRRHEVGVDANMKKDTESVSKYCAGATSGYTGYLSTDNDSKHFYFAFFESRSKPKEDPLVLWMNGGPGCSSMTV